MFLTLLHFRPDVSLVALVGMGLPIEDISMQREII
jgi:hypothetical protein